MPICDNCQTAAYDIDPHYFINLPRDQARSEMDLIALEMGADLPDHVCDLTEDPELPTPATARAGPGRPLPGTEDTETRPNTNIDTPLKERTK